jgi:hypothetical protein
MLGYKEWQGRGREPPMSGWNDDSIRSCWKWGRDRERCELGCGSCNDHQDYVWKITSSLSPWAIRVLCMLSSSVDKNVGILRKKSQKRLFGEYSK